MGTGDAWKVSLFTGMTYRGENGKKQALKKNEHKLLHRFYQYVCAKATAMQQQQRRTDSIPP
jgi:hypothetical protein